MTKTIVEMILEFLCHEVHPMKYAHSFVVNVFFRYNIQLSIDSSNLLAHGGLATP